jgi:hypothetical protein
MSFGILGKKDIGSDKCPRCSRTGVDFVIIQEGVLGCFDCGCVFLTKAERVKTRTSASVPKVVVPEIFTEENVGVAQTEEQLPCKQTVEGATPSIGSSIEVGSESADWMCPVCQKVCKNKLGLTSHMRTHQGGTQCES